MAYNDRNDYLCIPSCVRPGDVWGQEKSLQQGVSENTVNLKYFLWGSSIISMQNDLQNILKGKEVCFQYWIRLFKLRILLNACEIFHNNSKQITNLQSHTQHILRKYWEREREREREREKERSQCCRKTVTQDRGAQDCKQSSSEVILAEVVCYTLLSLL